MKFEKVKRTKENIFGKIQIMKNFITNTITTGYCKINMVTWKSKLLSYGYTESKLC